MNVHTYASHNTIDFVPPTSFTIMSQARERIARLETARRLMHEAMIVLGPTHRHGSSAAAILTQALNLAVHADAALARSDAQLSSMRFMIQRAIAEGLLDGTLVRSRDNRNLIRLSSL